MIQFALSGSGISGSRSRAATKYCFGKLKAKAWRCLVLPDSRKSQIQSRALEEWIFYFIRHPERGWKEPCSDAILKFEVVSIINNPLPRSGLPPHHHLSMKQVNKLINHKSCNYLVSVSFQELLQMIHACRIKSLSLLKR